MAAHKTTVVYSFFAILAVVTAYALFVHSSHDYNLWNNMSPERRLRFVTDSLEANKLIGKRLTEVQDIFGIPDMIANSEQWRYEWFVCEKSSSDSLMFCYHVYLQAAVDRGICVNVRLISKD